MGGLSVLPSQLMEETELFFQVKSVMAQAEYWLDQKKKESKG